MAPQEGLAFGVLLKRYRLANGLTQEALAERALLSARAISDLERGINHTARPDTVTQLIEALDLSLEERAALQSARAIAAERPSPSKRADTSTSLPDHRPSELRVFMFADVRDYSRFTHERGDEAGARLAAKFIGLGREVVARSGGDVIEVQGDQILAVFASARQALQAAVKLQQRIAESADASLPLQCGIGLDAGEPIPFEGGFRGGALNLGARLCSLAGPGEVLATESVVHLAQKTEGLTYREQGEVRFKGFDEPLRVMQVVSDSNEITGYTQVHDYPPTSPIPIAGFLGALPTGVMVARQTELDTILRAADAVAGASGRLVMLVGEPGVGKTRLAQEVTLALRDRGFLVACGRCYEPHRTTPYYPFLEALVTAYAAAPPALRAAAPHRWPYLGRLLPDQLTPPVAGSSEGQDEQQRLVRTVTSFLLEIASTTPVAILLDDLHWADGASLELLHHLTRHTRAYPVLLLGTFRDLDVERRAPLRQTLVDLGREQLMERITISRLGSAGTAALVAATFEGGDTATELAPLIHRHTDGNPFFIQEVLRALVERGHVYWQNGRWEREDVRVIEVPENVRAAIEERVSRLSQDTQAILHDASVLGQTFSFEDLLALGGWLETDLEHALAEATEAGLVRELQGDTYGFNHALTQQALYGDLSTRRKRKLHLAAGEALESLPEQVRMRRAAELAWHFLEGQDKQRALTYATLAGDRASLISAHAEAEQFFRTALELARSLDESLHTVSVAAGSAVQAKILQKLGEVLKNLVRYDEALELLEQAAAMYHAAGDVQNKLAVTAQIGSIHHVAGSWQQGISRILEALEPLQEKPQTGNAPSREEAALGTSLAYLYMKEGKYGASLAASVRSGEIAREVGDDRILAQAEAARGDALRLLGHPSEALHVLEHSLQLTETLGDDDTLFLALDAVAEMCMLNGDLQRCKELHERAAQVVDRTGDLSKITFETTSLGNISFYIGSWHGARAHFERALHLARSMGLRLSTARALFGLGMQYLAEGEWGASRRYLEEGVALCEEVNNCEMLSVGSVSLAELELLEGNPQAARARLESLLERPGLSEPSASSLLPALAWCHLELGDEGQAEQIVTRALKEASAQQNRLALVEALRVRGMLLARQRSWDQATGTFDESIALARAMPFPYHVARLLRDQAAVDMNCGRLSQARLRMEEAIDIFRRLGARRDVKSAAAALR